MIKTLCALVTFATVWHSCKSVPPTDIVFPTSTWSTAIPARFNIKQRQLDDALAYLASKSFQDGLNEVLIIKNGYIIYEGDSTHVRHNIYSCSKGFTGTVLGLLVDAGRVQLDDRAADFDTSLLALYPDVTFRHFATMTSGYSAAGRSRWNDENADWSWTPYEPETPHFAPGTHYEYWDEAQMTFGKVLTTILREPMRDYLQRNLTDALGMGDWEWYPEQELEGIPINNGCTNVIVNARQLARFGWLYLNRGRWNDQQLLSENWCRMATTSQVPSATPVYGGDRQNVQGSGSYGFNWWVNSSDGLSRLPDAPPGTAYLSGLNHNICCIIPEWNMVIIRMGDDRNPPEGKHVVWNEFLRRLKIALPD